MLQVKKLRRNGAIKAIIPQIKMNQFCQIGEAITWQFSLYLIPGHDKVRQASNAKERCQDGGRQHYGLLRPDEVLQI